MKVVDLVTRKSDQLSLHFYDFSMNLYLFYKFAIFVKTKEKGNKIMHLGPCNDLGACRYAPGRTLEQGKRRTAEIWRLWLTTSRPRGWRS